ncbi:MAG TPA: pyrroline-5-carboxylate reductase [Steroidobacteraceae bacterium]|nr:pyrroline-5-carboxylate reductase [Steroidobacteraceae bacterium]
MRDQRLAFIGGGNMAQSLIAGLLARGWPAARISVADPVETQRNRIQAEYGVATTGDNLSAIRDADVIVLAVKPQDLADVARQIAPALLGTAPLAISVAAGVRASDVARWLGLPTVVRAMPNRPALVGYGASALYAPAAIGAAERELASDILAAVGLALWVDDESLMDAVTAVSGSGPAYFFLLIEMLEESGAALGLDSATARRLAIATAYGSARMARDTDSTPAELRQQVTSKGGTTAAALTELENAGVRDIFRRAVAAAAARSAELAEQLSGS